MFREKRYKSKKKVKESDRKDPVKSHRPDLPVTGPGEFYITVLGWEGGGGWVSAIGTLQLALP